MNFDFEKIWKSKREFRKRLAGMPISKKFEMLDALHQRALAIRGATPPQHTTLVREEPPSDRKVDNAR